jgi:hypothetical protein
MLPLYATLRGTTWYRKLRFFFAKTKLFGHSHPYLFLGDFMYPPSVCVKYHWFSFAFSHMFMKSDSPAIPRKTTIGFVGHFRRPCDPQSGIYFFLVAAGLSVGLELG